MPVQIIAFTVVIASALAMIALFSSVIVVSVITASITVLICFGLLLSTAIGSAFIATIIANILLVSFFVLRMLYRLRTEGPPDGFYDLVDCLRACTYYVPSIPFGFRETSLWKALGSGEHDQSTITLHGRDKWAQDGRIEVFSGEDAVQVQGW